MEVFSSLAFACEGREVREEECFITNGALLRLVELIKSEEMQGDWLEIRLIVTKVGGQQTLFSVVFTEEGSMNEEVFVWCGEEWTQAN